MRANDERDKQVPGQDTQDATVQAQATAREPYTPPVIEKFPPMGNVTFGTNIQPTTAMSLAGA